MANRVETVDIGVPLKSLSFSSVVDTTFRRFATETLRIKIHPGPSFNARIGNMFERFISNKGFLDVYYDLYAKGKKHVGAKLDTSKWDATILKQNSYKMEHKLGLNFAYQFDKHVRFELGGKYTFMGRNVAEIWEANTAIRADF